jgi:hypothetical protein
VVLLVLASARAPAANAAVSIPPPVQSALEAASSIPQARIEVTSYAPQMPAGCHLAGAELGRTLAGSGRLAVKLVGNSKSGEACSGWAWVGVRMFARVLVAARPLREGDALEGATDLLEREIAAGRELLLSPSGATAARSLTRGAIIEAGFARAVGVRPGESIKVIVAAGALQVDQTGRSVGCGRGKACAVLPSGKHVEGVLVQGRLLVQVP